MAEGAPLRPVTWLGGVRRGMLELPRGLKRAALVLNDLALLSLALWLSLSLRLSTFYSTSDPDLLAILILAPLTGVVVFFQMGLYRLVTRYISARGTVSIFLAAGLATLLWSVMVLMSGQALSGVPRSVIILYGTLSAFFVWASRQFAGFLLKGLPNVTLARFDDDRKPVAIYGAGSTGVQLLDSLRRSRAYRAVGFIDENPSLWGQVVGGLKVYRPGKIERLVDRDGIKEVMLAMPEATRRRRQEIIREITRHRVTVKTLPGFEDIAAGRVSVSDLRSLDVDDLLGRDAVPPNRELMERSIAGKRVLVTGAGGSIGSELVRQIMKLAPETLVLLDQSEPALYQIDQEVRALQPAGERPVRIVGVLGSVLDQGLVRSTLARHRIQTIYHAAAYKHVPIVEANPVAGLVNNTLGTRLLADAARACDVERFILISTDKAVRPTNVMGASKRLAELVLQAYAAERADGCVFGIVRFGNVLDSSGSVVRLFRRQIEAGGPVTVTHPEVIRYFMSIPEAAQLVIQAGSMAKGGDVFVLDMGEPVKIDQLARSMIRLMGREPLDADHPDGDIEIVYTGLRPGEKLYEELLIGEGTVRTEHPRISMCHEPFRPLAVLDRELERLRTALGAHSLEAIQAILSSTVDGYAPERPLAAEESAGEDGDGRSARTIH